MKWFNNISTLVKLIIGFGVILLLSAVVIITAHKSLTGIAESEKRIEEFSFNKAVSLQELRNNWNYSRGQMLELTLTDNRADQKAIEKSINARSLLIDDLIETLFKLDPDPRFQSQFTEINNILAEYRKTQEQQITFISQVKPEAARQLSLGVQADRYEKIRVLASQLIDREREFKKTIALDMRRQNGQFSSSGW